MEGSKFTAPVSRRTFLAATAATGVAAAALVACGGDEETTTTEGGTDTTGAGSETTVAGGDTTVAPETTMPSGEGKPGGTLRIGVVGSTNDIVDGQYIVAKADQARLLMGWEPLVHYDADFNIAYEHSLAESVESDAADHYVIKLKSGITFHNGNPVTADDVIYSFMRRIDPDLGLAPALSAFIDESSLTKVDDLTVDVKLLQPSVIFLNALAEYTMTIVPTGYTREDAEQVGTGPFVLKSFTPGAESVHVRNDAYWGGAAYLDEVQIIDFADATAMINALKSGDVDVIVDVPFGEVAGIEGTDLNIIEATAGNWLTITMAIDQAPMDDVRVRQAMRLICDREEMVNRVLAGHGSVANDLYGRLDPCYASDIPQRTQDLEEAKRLLEEAGQAGMTIDLFAPDDTGGLPELIAVFAEQAAGAGITVNAQVLDGGTYWGDEYTKRTFATSFWGTRPYLAQVGAGSLKTATYPETHWPMEGSDFEAKYLEALQTVDVEARCAIVKEMQMEEWESGGFIIPFFNNLIDATAPYVKGFEARPNTLNLDHYGRGMKRIWLDV